MDQAKTWYNLKGIIQYKVPVMSITLTLYLLEPYIYIFISSKIFFFVEGLWDEDGHRPGCGEIHQSINLTSDLSTKPI